MTEASDKAIPLEQIAAVFAAEQEGFALEEVLAVEGIESELWEPARAESIVSVATDVEQHARYTEALIASQDRLHCDVAPVFDDVSAWVAFVHAVDKASFATLASTHGLVSNDLSRLERHWRTRFAEDAALSKQAKALRKSPPALPALVVGERTLVPSPYAKAKDSEVEAPAEPAAEEDGDGYDQLHRMATLYAVLSTNVSLVASFTRFGFDDIDTAKKAITLWDTQIKENEQLRNDFRALVSHYRRRRELHVSPPSRRAALASTDRNADTAASPLPEVDIDETAVLGAGFIPLEALPFADAADVPDSPDTTAFLQAIVFDGPSHPFEQEPPSEPDGEEEEELDATSAVIPALRFSAPTPFEQREAAAGDATPEASDDVSNDDARNDDVDETCVVKGFRFETLPFGAVRRDAEQRDVTGLTIEQYASYCVELMLYPDKRAPIRARYRIQDETDHDKMNQHWNSAMAASPTTRTRFQAIYNAYRTHLNDHPIQW